MKMNNLKIICTHKPENKSGFFLLILAILFGSIGIWQLLAVTLTTPIFEAFGLITCLFLVIILSFIVLDEAIWQLIGKESLLYDKTKLVVVQKRLFCRKQEIAWRDILHIDTMKQNSLWKIITYLTIAGTDQKSIQIVTRRKKVKCGVNLSLSQVQALKSQLDTLTLELSNGFCNSDQ